MDVEEALDWGDDELDQELQFGMEAHVQVEEAGEIETETEMGEIKAEVDQASELPQITTEPQSQSQGDKLDILQEQGNQAEAIPIPSASPISIRRQPSRSISISPSPSFYSSASSNLSTSDNPISSEEAKEGLPQGWTAIQDKECQLYYFHPVSGKTTRKRPKQELERDRIWALRNFGSKEQKEAERRSRFGGKRSATYNLGQEDKGATSKLSRNDYPMMDFNSSLSSENRRDFPNKRSRSTVESSIESPHTSTLESTSNYRICSASPSHSPTLEQGSYLYRERNAEGNDLRMDVDLPPPSRGGNETRSMELKGWTETSGRKPIEAKGVVPIDDELEDIADYENAREVEAQLLGIPFEPSAKQRPSLLSRLSGLSRSVDSSEDMSLQEEQKPISKSQKAKLKKKKRLAEFLKDSAATTQSPKQAVSTSSVLTGLSAVQSGSDEHPRRNFGSSKEDGRRVEEQENGPKVERPSGAFTRQDTRYQRSPSRKGAVSPNKVAFVDSTRRASVYSPNARRRGLDPHPSDIDRYIPTAGKDPNFSDSHTWISSHDERERVRSLLTKRIFHNTEADVDEEDARRGSLLREKISIEEREYREREGDATWIPGGSYENQRARKQSISSFSSRSGEWKNSRRDDYPVDLKIESERDSKQRHGRRSLSPQKSNQQVSTSTFEGRRASRGGHLEELENARKEDDFYREQRMREKSDRSEREYSNYSSSNQSLYYRSSQFSSDRHAPPPIEGSRRKSPGSELHQSLTSSTSASNTSPVLPISKGLDSPSTLPPEPSSSSTTERTAPFIHPDRLKALESTSASTGKTETSQAAATPPLQYYRDNAPINSGALTNAIGVPMGAGSQCVTGFRGDTMFNFRGRGAARGGFGGGFRGRFIGTGRGGGRY